MKTETLHIHYRPIRVGFLVKRGDIEGLLKVIELNTISWGGIYNPIFPITDSGSDIKELAKVWRVDVVSNLYSDEGIDKIGKACDWLDAGYDFKDLMPVINSVKASPLQDLLPFFQKYYENVFRFKADASKCIDVSWNNADELSSFYSVLCGSFPSGFAIDYRESYKRLLKAEQVTLDNLVPEDLGRRMKPIESTGTELRWELMGATTGNGFYVGDPTDFDDLVNFWNIRAAGSIVVFLSTKTIPKLDGFRNLETKTLVDKVKGLDRYRSTLSVWSKTGSADTTWLRTQYDGNRLVHDQYDGPRSLLPDNRSLLPLHQTEKTSVNVVYEESSDKTLHANVLLPSVIRDDERRPIQQHYITGVRGYGRILNETFTIHPPYWPELNQWLSHRITLGDEIRVQPEGIDVIRGGVHENLYLYPVTFKDTIQAVFDQVGLEATRDITGRMTDRIISQMGGLDRCRVFKIPGARELIWSNKVKRGISVDHAKSIIMDSGSFEKHRGLFIEKREATNLEAIDVLNFLLKRKAMRTGVEVKCPHCELDMWLSISTLSDTLTCEYCGHQFPAGPYLTDSNEFSYRLSQLFFRKEIEDDKQKGAIPVILALQLLTRVERFGTSPIYSTPIKLRDKGNTTSPDINCEVDLVVMQTSGDECPSIILGECKTRDSISQQDVDNLKKLYAKLKSNSLSPYLLFAKVSSFSDAEIQMFKSLKNEGIRLILFTDKELDCYELYNAYDESGLEKHVHDFEHLVSNSAIRYLR